MHHATQRGAELTAIATARQIDLHNQTGIVFEPGVGLAVLQRQTRQQLIVGDAVLDLDEIGRKVVAAQAADVDVGVGAARREGETRARCSASGGSPPSTMCRKRQSSQSSSSRNSRSSCRLRT